MSSRVAVVSILALLAVAPLAGCPSAASELAGDDRDDDGDLAPGANDCEVDADCAPAGASCCECPTFAVPAASGWEDSCDGVDCTDPGLAQDCPLTEAVCDLGACVLRCQAVTCSATCAGGFARDEAGCLVCDCADPSPPGDIQCAVDADCVQVPADCCGCAQGGTDTAVPSSEADSFSGELQCDSNPICPGIDTCDATLVPRCVGGQCALADAGGGGLGPDAGPDESPADPQYCGDDSLPPCPAGLECVINHPDHGDATAAGLGVCLAR